MNPTVAALMDLSRLAAAAVQACTLTREQRAALIASAHDNGWGLLAEYLRESDRPTREELERLTDE